jgi:hypothetical protein
MADDRRWYVADAAQYLQTEDAEQLINEAWKRATYRFQGVPAGGSEPVEIPPDIDGRLDCNQSRVVDDGGLFATYDRVTMSVDDTHWMLDDVDRRAREAEETASPAPQQNETPPDMQEAGWLTRPVAAELRKIHPDGDPQGVRRRELREQVYKSAGAGIGKFSLTTLDRAREVAWLDPKRPK